MRILCVDDDSIARVIYMQGMTSAFTEDEICVAESGQNALDLIMEDPFDIVITDLMMPGISGMDLLLKIKELTPLCQVIMVTGKASVDTAVESMRRGARDYIEKPIDIPLLKIKTDNIREYFNSIRDAEEMREAKEQFEENAGKEVHKLEVKLQTAETALYKALEIMADIEKNLNCLKSSFQFDHVVP